MAIAMTLRNYLDQHDIDYDVVFHPKSHGSMHSAKLAHVPPDSVAKSVILEDDDGYVMAVIPTSRRVQLGVLSQELQRPLRLAVEHELGKLFRDCQLGAVPPIGTAYGLETMVDDALGDKPDVYFEAGDHEELIHVKGQEFMALMAGARRCRFSQPAAGIETGSSQPPMRYGWDYDI